MRSSPFRAAWPLAFLLWLGLIASGYAWLLRYSFAAGQSSTAPRTLPPSLGLPSPLVRAQLFLALHPRCPCSRATVSELAKILTHAPDVTDVTVLMYKPAEESDGWMAGSLAEECRRMKCRICPDPDGRFASLLGCLTSGSVVFYDANAQLRYQGGITASRGHEGDNAGERAVIEILRGERPGQKSMPVFGCPIREPLIRQQHL